MIDTILVVSIGTALIGLLIFWGFKVFDARAKWAARSQLMAAVFIGDAKSAAAAIRVIDPSGKSTYSNWLGIGHPMPAGTPDPWGFTWILGEWRIRGHQTDPGALFDAASLADPPAAFNEALIHLSWLQSSGSRDSMIGFFERTTRLALDVPPSPALSSALSELVAHSQRDSKISLMIWEQFQAKSREKELPPSLIKTAVGHSNFADPESFERILKLTGILERAPNFQVHELPFEAPPNGGNTWIEWISRALLKTSDPSLVVGRKWFFEARAKDIKSDQPGLFLIQRLLDDSRGEHFPEIDPERISPALSNLEQLPEDSKNSIARILDEYIPSFKGHQSLGNWVWIHHEPAWELQRQELLNIDSFEDELNQVWVPTPLLKWIRTATKHTQAEKTAPVIHHLWSLRMKHKREQWIASKEDHWGDHPFSYFEQPYFTSKGNSLATESISLFLEVGKDSAIPPTSKFPRIFALAFGSGPNSGWRPPWYKATPEEFLQWVIELGSYFSDDSARLLIVPCFRSQGVVFSETLRQPENLAKFVSLANQSDADGSWLAKDLAELAPRWWLKGEADLVAFERAGGVLGVPARAEAYIRNTQIPVGARVSYALGIVSWETYSYTPSDHLDVSFTPALTDLCLEFANEIRLGRWNPRDVPNRTMMILCDIWLGEKRAVGGAQPKPLGGPDADSLRSNARETLILALEKEVRQVIDASPKSPPVDNWSSSLERAKPFLQLYALLLRHERRVVDLSKFWDEIDGRMKRPSEVAPWIVPGGTDPASTGAKILAENLAETFMEHGWPGVNKQIGSLDQAVAVSSLSETSAFLPLDRWFEFVSEVLKQLPEKDSSNSGERDRFFALAPGLSVIRSSSLSNELRSQAILVELSRPPDVEFHEAYFSLALPRVLRQLMVSSSFASEFEDLLAKLSTGSIPTAFLDDLKWSASPKGLTPVRRHLDALGDSRVPLSERWAAANFFSMIGSDSRRVFPLKLSDWSSEERELVEKSIDILVKAIEAGLPVWQIADSGLGTLDSRPHHKQQVLNRFIQLARHDPEGQSKRGISLIQPRSVEALLAGCPEKKWLRSALADLAISHGDYAVALSLFESGENELIFEEKVSWLLRAKQPKRVASLFEKEWRRCGETLPIRIATVRDPQVLSGIMAELPDDPDLRFLVRVFLLPRNSTSAKFVYPVPPSLGGSALATEFLRLDFKSQEMERLVLELLPLAGEESPLLSKWLEKRLGDRSWADYLNEDSAPIRQWWPYWLRRLQALGVEGDIETLRMMLPDRKWFEGRKVGFSGDPSWTEGIPVESLIWMGFYEALGHALLSARDESLESIFEMVSDLISVEPMAEGSIFPGSKPMTGSGEYRRSAAEELSFLALARLLIFSRNESEEQFMAQASKLKFSSSSISKKGSDSSTLSASSFFRMVARMVEALPEAEKEGIFLRSFELSPFTSVLYSREMPLNAVLSAPLPKGFTQALGVKFARERLERQPHSRYCLGDLGVVLHKTGDSAGAIPILEKARSMLSSSADPVSWTLVNESLKEAQLKTSSPP